MYKPLYNQPTRAKNILPKISSNYRSSRFQNDRTQIFTILVEPFIQMYQTIGCQPAEQGGVLGGDRDRNLITTYYHDVHAARTSVQYDPSFEAINKAVFTIWGVDFIGVGHSHPGLPIPSYGDLVYADRLLNHMTRLQKFFMPIILPKSNNGGIFEFLPYVMLKKSPRNQVVRCVIKIVDNNGREISQNKALEFKIHHINTVPSLDEVDMDTAKSSPTIDDKSQADQENTETKTIQPPTSSEQPLVKLVAGRKNKAKEEVTVKLSDTASQPKISAQAGVGSPSDQIIRMARIFSLSELRNAKTPESVFTVLAKMAKMTSDLDGSNLQDNLTQIRAIFPDVFLTKAVQSNYPGDGVLFSKYDEEDDKFFSLIFSSLSPKLLLAHLGRLKNQDGNPYLHPELFNLIISEFSNSYDSEIRRKQSAVRCYQNIQNIH
jgi:hypothetical protein